MTKLDGSATVPPPVADVPARRRAGRRKVAGREQCRWCGRAFQQASGRGRPRQYCRQGCRQQAFLARKLAAAHGLGDGDAIVQREKLEELQSHLYCLQAALDDVDRDLANDPDADDVREALDWLLDNCAPLRTFWVEARTLDA